MEPAEDGGISEAASETIDPVANFGGIDALAEALDRALTPAERERNRLERAREAALTGKPKRGRPRAWAKDWRPHESIESHHNGLAVSATRAKTGRGRQEAEYAKVGGRALFKHRHEHPEVLEFTGIARVDSGEYPESILGKGRTGILAEFGRLIATYRNGEEVAVQWAVELAATRPRPTTKQAVAWIRQHRLGKSNPGTAGGLAEAIVATVNGYLDGHPGTTPAMIEDALHIALSAYARDDLDSDEGAE